MPARHKSRQRALQVLFTIDQRKQPVDDAIASYYATLGSDLESENAAPEATPPDAFMEELVRGTCRNQAAIDARISSRSANWRLERMPAVDRNVLRLALFEMQWLPTAPAIVIDEALELARQFAGDESVAFVNGVLDAIKRDGEKPAGMGASAAKLPDSE
ncbi:MAG: transcription antitermination factor NusB [Acidobacteriota bacterium]